MNSMIDKLTIYKTCNVDNFIDYVKEKTLNWDKWWEFAFHRKVRSLRFKIFIQEKRALAKIARNLLDKNKLNGKSDILLLWGNGGFKPTSRKWESAPNKGLRRKLSKWIPIVLVNEHKTSKISPCCHKEVINSKSKLFPSKKMLKRWQTSGTLDEKVVNWNKRNMVARGIKHCECGKTWNRDIMACLNIHFIFNEYSKTFEMPHPFTRKD